MGLNDLFKKLHNQTEKNTPSVLAKIEQYYVSKANDRDYDKTMEKMTRFHPSSVCYGGVCSRKYSIVMNKEDFGAELNLPEPHPTSLLRVFDHGHMIHDMYQNGVLAKSGILYGMWINGDAVCEGFYPGDGWLYQEPRLWWPKIRMSGYIDGIVVIDGEYYVLEIKSSNSNSFKYIKSVSKEPRDYHAKQAMLYCFGPNDLDNVGEIKGAIILYVNKETGEELDFYVEKDITLIQGILDGIDKAIIDSEQKNLPPRIEDCKTKKSRIAKECVACNFCFSSDSAKWEKL